MASVIKCPKTYKEQSSLRWSEQKLKIRPSEILHVLVQMTSPTRASSTFVGPLLELLQVANTLAWPCLCVLTTKH
jgi:hypothetical protein